MDYKSPLHDAYMESDNHGQARQQSSYGQRYAPYSHRRNHTESHGRQPLPPGVDRGSTYHRSTPEPRMPPPGRTAPHQHASVSKYSDRYRSRSYPKELTAMFGAEECKLCGVELLSPIVGKMHYSGKTHYKKVKHYLLDWSLRTGLPVPEINEPHTGSVGSSFSDYCDICAVTLTSINDKILHYSGKSHQKNERDPANAKKKKKSYETIDLRGRFGIGESFSSEVLEIDKDVKIGGGHFVCELCDVKAVSQDQLNQHLGGKKHKENVEKRESDVPKKERQFLCKLCNVSLDTRLLLDLHLKGKRHTKNELKMEMDNSGIDYCSVCDVSFTSIDHYKVHMIGKKHEKRCQSNPSKPTFRQAYDEKASVTCKLCPYVGNIENHKCSKSLAKMEFQNLENKWVCTVCHNMVFESEQEYKEHKSSNRHILCILNKEEGDLIIEDLKHWYCFICKKQCQNCKEYTAHFFEEQHLKLSEGQDNLESNTALFRCSVCNLTLTEEFKELHLRSRRHIRESLKRDTMITLTNLANKDITTTNFYCVNCNVAPKNFMQYSQHILGESHLEVMIDAKLSSLGPIPTSN